jgi:hypothetical protein
MQAQDVQDVLDLNQILESPQREFTPEGKASLIAELLDWHFGRGATDQAYPDYPDQGTDLAPMALPKVGRGKAKASAPEPDSFEATPDPASDEPDF